MKRILRFLSILVSVYGLSQVPGNVKIKDNLGNESFNVTCTNTLDTNGCIALNVEYPVIKQTTGYEVSSESYSPPVSLNQGTPLNANYDDLFAVKLDMPFKFCFYNQYFQSLVVGSNGMVTFDLGQLGNINYPNVQWQNPSTNLPKNSIFGAYHDMVFQQPILRKFITRPPELRLSGNLSSVFMKEGSRDVPSVLPRKSFFMKQRI
uniref:Uncharacterized protein n=1 Tax=Chryseobacterium endophyticum TaxID=1854762 RepID=A0AAU6WNC3_9FLAO